MKNSILKLLRGNKDDVLLAINLMLKFNNEDIIDILKAIGDDKLGGNHLYYAQQVLPELNIWHQYFLPDNKYLFIGSCDIGVRSIEYKSPYITNFIYDKKLGYYIQASKEE